MEFTFKPPIQQEQSLDTLQRNLVRIHPAFIVCVHYVLGPVVWTGHSKITSLPSLSQQSSRDMCEQMLAVVWCIQRLDDGMVATGWRKMTKYLGGKGIMPGKGTKLPAGLFKGRDVFSQAKTRNCFRWRTYHVQKQRDKKWNGLVRMQDARFHLPHTCTLCSQCQSGSLYICHHLA